MRCPACNYRSGEPGKCPKCDRGFSASFDRIVARKQFMDRLIVCHVIWLATGIGLPLYWTVRAEYGFAAFLFYMLPALVATLVVIIIEHVALLPALAELDASKASRNVLCALVGFAGPILCVCWRVGGSAFRIYVFFLFAALIGSIWYGVQSHRRTLERIRMGSCTRCGYDHRGLDPVATCPECGEKKI
jgi:hypothetical protein